MPLPRFDRLAAARRREILDVATTRLARDGIDTASYNQILSEASLPKASAYHYFDGRADLVETVLRDVAGQVFGALGDWVPQPTVDDFRIALAGAAERLTAHLVTHPDHRALAPAILRLTADLPGPRAWVDAAVTNGREIGLIRADLPHELMAGATLAVLQAIDSWAIARMLTSPDDQPPVDPATALSLLEGLWGGSQKGARR